MANFSSFFPSPEGNSNTEPQENRETVEPVAITQSGDVVTVTATGAATFAGNSNFFAGEPVLLPGDGDRAISGIIDVSTDTVLTVDVDIPGALADTTGTYVTSIEHGLVSFIGGLDAGGDVNIATGTGSNVTIGNSEGDIFFPGIIDGGPSVANDRILGTFSNNALAYTSRNSFANTGGNIATWAEGGNEDPIPADKFPTFNVATDLVFNTTNTTFTPDTIVAAFVADWNQSTSPSPEFNISAGEELTSGVLIILHTDDFNEAVIFLDSSRDTVSRTDVIAESNFSDITTAAGGVTMVMGANGVTLNQTIGDVTAQLDSRIFNVTELASAPTTFSGDQWAFAQNGTLSNNPASGQLTTTETSVTEWSHIDGIVLRQRNSTGGGNAAEFPTGFDADASGVTTPLIFYIDENNYAIYEATTVAITRGGGSAQITDNDISTITFGRIIESRGVPAFTGVPPTLRLILAVGQTTLLSLDGLGIRQPISSDSNIDTTANVSAVEITSSGAASLNSLTVGGASPHLTVSDAGVLDTDGSVDAQGVTTTTLSATGQTTLDTGLTGLLRADAGVVGTDSNLSITDGTPGSGVFTSQTGSTIAFSSVLNGFLDITLPAALQTELATAYPLSPGAGPELGVVTFTFNSVEYTANPGQFVRSSNASNARAITASLPNVSPPGLTGTTTGGPITNVTFRVGTIASLNLNGRVDATEFVGNGSLLTGLPGGVSVSDPQIVPVANAAGDDYLNSSITVTPSVTIPGITGTISRMSGTTATVKSTLPYAVTITGTPVGSMIAGATISNAQGGPYDVSEINSPTSFTLTGTSGVPFTAAFGVGNVASDAGDRLTIQGSSWTFVNPSTTVLGSTSIAGDTSIVGNLSTTGSISGATATDSPEIHVEGSSAGDYKFRTAASGDTGLAGYITFVLE